MTLIVSGMVVIHVFSKPPLLDIFRPEEKTTWTAGAVLMAADALNQITPAVDLFTRVSPPHKNEQHIKDRLLEKARALP